MDDQTPPDGSSPRQLDPDRDVVKLARRAVLYHKELIGRGLPLEVAAQLLYQWHANQFDQSRALVGGQWSATNEPDTVARFTADPDPAVSPAQT